MIVIHKKRIQMIVSCVLIAVFAFSFQIANNQRQLENKEERNKEQSNSIATTATPVSGKTIVIDARSSEYQMRGHKVAQEQQRQKPI